MSEPTPDRPMDDDLDQAYARSHALADDGRAPSASVRANVLAAAALVAAAQDAAAAAPPLVPVAPPVATVGRGRDRAINLSSWRVRSGAAFCALMLVCLGIWRLDEHGRVSGGVQVALAELRLAEPRTAPAPQDLPLPAATAASYPYAAPPPVVVDPLDNSAGVRGAAAKRAERDKDVVVAQLDEPEKRAAVQADRLAQSRAAQPAAARPAANAVAADAAAAPPPVALASTAPAEQESATVTIVAAAPGASPQVMTAPPKLPSVLPRRVLQAPRPAAPPARPAAAGDTVVASAEADSRSFDVAVARAKVQSAAPSEAKAPDASQVTITGIAASPRAPAMLSKPADPSAVLADAAKKAAPAGSHVQATRLQQAANDGDVETLRQLLADPATRIEVTDTQGRTALMYAVLAARAPAVRLLLAAGADPDHADQAGRTPRELARTGPNAEIAALLGAAR